MDNEEDDLDKAILEGEIELDKKKADELRAIRKFLEEKTKKAKKLRKYLSDFRATRTDFISEVDRLKDQKRLIARFNYEHNNKQLLCKAQAFIGNYFGFFGLLAAPLTGGASLLVSGASTVVSATGIYGEYKADGQHAKEISQLMEVCYRIQENIQKRFSELESTINKIKEIIEQPAKIDRQIVLINLPNITGCSNNTLAIKLAECILLPLKYIDRVLSVQKCVTVTCIEFNKTFLFVNTSISVVKGLTESTIRLKPIFTACKLSSMAVQTSLNGVVTLSRNGVSMQIVQTSMSINKLSTSISTTVGGVTIQQSCNVLRVNKMKQVVSVSRKAPSTAIYISKTAMVLGIASLYYDLYRICSHEKPTESQTEKDIQNLIDECERNMTALDKFIIITKDELESYDQMYS